MRQGCPTRAPQQYNWEEIGRAGQHRTTLIPSLFIYVSVFFDCKNCIVSILLGISFILGVVDDRSSGNEDLS